MSYRGRGAGGCELQREGAGDVSYRGRGRGM